MVRHVKNNYSNIAQLKELTRTPPMSGERHAAILRKRNANRRMIEDSKELKAASDTLSQSR